MASPMLSFHGRRLGRIPMDPTGDWSWTSVSAVNLRAGRELGNVGGGEVRGPRQARRRIADCERAGAFSSKSSNRVLNPSILAGLPGASSMASSSARFGSRAASRNKMGACRLASLLSSYSRRLRSAYGAVTTACDARARIVAAALRWATARRLARPSRGRPRRASTSRIALSKLTRPRPPSPSHPC